MASDPIDPAGVDAPFLAQVADVLESHSMFAVSVPNDQQVPELFVALGCRLNPTGRVGVLLDGRAAGVLERLLHDSTTRVSLGAYRPLALAQVIGDHGKLELVDPAWRDQVLGGLDAAMARIGGHVHSAEWVATAFYQFERTGLRCLSFLPTTLLKETPGPNAGQRVHRGERTA